MMGLGFWLIDFGKIRQIKELEKKHKIITLVYSAKDEKRNNAIVLAEVLSKFK